MMATQQNESSVIARLMWLDDPPRQPQPQPVYRQQRVFSENYFQRVDSIGSYERRSRTIRRKPKIKDCLKSSIVDSGTRNIEERNDLGGMSLVLRPNLGNVKRESRPLFLLDSCMGWEFKKQLLERSKRKKVSREIWSSKKVCDRGGMPSMLDLESKKRLEIGTRVVIRNDDGWKDNSVPKLPVFKRFNRSLSGKTKFKNVSKCDFRLSSVGRDKNVSEVSSSFDVPFEKELVPCEEGFTSLNCIEVDDELTRSMGEAYQPSPNSVLEPDNSSSSEYGESVCTDLNGLWMKLQILKSESEENQSTVVLSKEDASEGSVSVGQNTKPIKCFGPKESQQFLYLVNVLNEMGFHGGNVELDFERCMTDPVLFKTLEKKYENQESWNRADRRLLFDRISLGLTEVVWSKPLRRKMSSALRRDVVEEELWNMLVSQEKEVNVDLSKNSVWKEPWLELRDEVDSIVVEIEAFLVDELARELVTD